jgi:curved DNA-binding protein CbpA
MDPDAARALLGVDPAASPETIRRRYLELIRRHHPDVAVEPTAVDPAEVTEAYRVLRAAPARAVAGRSAARVDVTADVDTVSVSLPPDETFLELLDVMSAVGAVTYADPEGGLIEALLELTSGGRCSLVAALQGRAAHGSTDVFITLDDPTAAEIARLTGELVELLDRSLNS